VPAVKKTFFVLFALALVVAILAGGSAFLLRQKELNGLARLTVQAEDMLKSHKYEDAITMLKKVQAETPSDRSTYLLGKTYYEQGKPEEGIKYYKQVIEKYPDRPAAADAHLELAKHLFSVEHNTEAAQQHVLTTIAKLPNSQAADFALVLLAKINLQKHDEARAKASLDPVMKKPNSPARDEAEFLIGDLNMKALKSPDIAPGDETYTIQKGDTLSKMERKLKVPADLLAGINGLDDPRALRVGRELRVPHLNISVVIDKSARTLTLKNNGQFLKKYHAGIAQDDAALPDGDDYSVQKKFKDGKAWQDPKTNQVVKAGQPGNPFGDRYIELRNDRGIHGTDDPDKIGKLISEGTVALTNQDVKEVYALVEVKTPVVVKGHTTSEGNSASK